MKTNFINNHLQRDWLSNLFNGGSASGATQNASNGGGTASNAIGTATSALTGGAVDANTPAANNPFSLTNSFFIGLLDNLFGGNANADDWKGWDAQDSQENRDPGVSAAWWTKTDGDSVSNEARNVFSYISNKADGYNKVVSAAIKYFGYTEKTFLEALVSKFKRGGLADVAAKLLEQASTSPASTNTAASTTNTSLNIVPANNGYNAATPSTSKKNITMYAVVAGIIIVVGIGIYFLVRKRK